MPTKNPYLTNTSTYVNIIYSENYSYVDLINLGIGAAGDLIVECQTDSAGVMATHGHVFHFIDPNYKENVLEPEFDKRYVRYEENGVDVSAPGTIYAQNGIIANTWYSKGENNENHEILCVSTGSALSDKYNVIYKSDVVLSGMDDIYLGNQSLKTGITECLSQLGDMLPSSVFYQNFVMHENMLNDQANAIQSLQELMDKNFKEDEERFNFHNQDVNSLINELDQLHTQIDTISNNYDIDVPDLRKRIVDLTTTVSEVYVQVSNHISESDTHFDNLDSSVNQLYNHIDTDFLDLSTYAHLRIEGLNSSINWLIQWYDNITTNTLPAIDASIQNIDASIGQYSEQIVWLYQSAEQQDSDISKLIEDVALLKTTVGDGTNLDAITELINSVKEDCNAYTDEQFEPIKNLMDLGIVTNESIQPINAEIEKKVDSSVYINDVSVLTSVAIDLNSRVRDIEDYIKQKEVDETVNSSTGGTEGPDVADLEARVRVLETKIAELTILKKI